MILKARWELVSWEGQHPLWHQGVRNTRRHRADNGEQGFHKQGCIKLCISRGIFFSKMRGKGKTTKTRKIVREKLGREGKLVDAKEKRSKKR